MAERLEDLLRACTVRVLGGPMPGAGFFVAPGKVMTCFHVIGDSPALTVRWERDGQLPVEAPVAGRVLVLADRGRPIPALDRDYPDLAVLEVAGLEGHPCVGIDTGWPGPEDGFQVFGYPREGGAVQLTAARLTYRGTKGIQPATFLDLASDTVKPGMSGAAVLNLRSGAVCGVIVASKHRAQPDGALAIPWSAVDTDLGAVLAANRDFHRQDRRWNAAAAAAEPAYRATLRQLRAGVLQDRDKELAAIAAFATGQPSPLAPPGSQHAWLVGGPWAGKTALLAEAVHALPPEVDCVAYFLRRPTGDADRERFLAAVVPQLAWLLGTDPPAAPDEHVFRQLWEQAAQRAADQGRQLLLVVDGLDEDLRPGGYSVAGWLPGRLSGMPARVLVASRMSPPLPADMDPAHPLAALVPDKVYTLPNSPHAARLRKRADQEITQLLGPAGDDLALDVLGLLTAARGGPLAIADLATVTGSRPLKVRGVLNGEAARILQRVGPADTPRYTFAHETLFARCQHDDDVGDPDYTRRIDEWAATWRDRGWPAARNGKQGTPLYLLDRYPQTLYDDPPRLAALAGDAGWVTAAIQTLGVDAVLAELKTADAAAPGEPRLAAMHAVVRRQAHHLRDREAVGDPGFVPRQLCLQAAELGETLLAADCRTRQLASDDPGPVLQWTTRRASPALILELGRYYGGEEVAVAVLLDGRVVSGGDGRVLVWDPGDPGADPVELGRHSGVVTVAVLPDGRVVSGGGEDGRVLVWDPGDPGADPVELGRHSGVLTVAALPDGRVVSGGRDGRVMAWDPGDPGADPVELGRRVLVRVAAVAVLPDGRVVSGGSDGRVMVWDPSDPGTGQGAPIRHGRIHAVAVLPDGRVVSGGSLVLVWDPGALQRGPVELGRRHPRARAPRPDIGVAAVAVLPDGRVASGGADGRVMVWDPGDPRADPVELGRHDRMVTAAAVLRDGRVVSGGRDRRVLVWDPDAAQRGPVKLGRSDSRVEAVAVLPDGRVVSSGGSDGRVLVWDPGDPEAGPVQLGRHGVAMVVAVAVLPDGRVVSSGGRVLVWDPGDPGAGPVEFGRHGGVASVAAVAVLPDGRVVSGGEDGQVLVWDPGDPVADPVELGRHGRYGRGPPAVAVLPDGRVVSGGEDGRVLVWDPGDPVAGPVELGRYGGMVIAVAVLPDGRVVSGGEDGRVLVWDPGDPVAGPVELGRHGGMVIAVAVLPDGRAVSSGDDDRVRLWDVRGSSAGNLLACSAYALAASRSPSGDRLFIGHARGGISCWELRPATKNTPGARQRAG